MRHMLLHSLFFLSFAATGQQKTEWATKVLGYSSQLTPLQYSAAQALGKPNVMPAGGENPNAWMPAWNKKIEYLKLEIKQIAVVESCRPGALGKVYLYDEAGKEHLVFTLSPLGGPAHSGFVRNIFIEKTPYKAAAVKLEMFAEFDGGGYAIDAVAIADSPRPIAANIDVPKRLRKGILADALAPHLNSEHDELNPVLSPDGKTLFFSRCNSPENVGGAADSQDIWFAEMQPDGHWGEAKNLRELNSKGPNFVNSAMMVKGKPALLLGNVVNQKGKTLPGLAKSTFDHGKWSAPQQIRIENNYNKSRFANYFMSSSGILLMSAERDDTRGDRDLYVCFEKADGSFTQPLNLGNAVNSAASETSPFLASDDRTLFFSSNGFSGYGGRDIYVTHRLDNSWTNWSAPENLGPDINTKLNDTFFTVPQGSKHAYFSREAESHNIDMMKAEMPILLPSVKVKGKVVNNQLPVLAEVVFMRDNKTVGKIKTDPNAGDYAIILPGGYFYQCYAQEQANRSSIENIDLSKFTVHRDSEQDSVLVNTLSLMPAVAAAKEQAPDARQSAEKDTLRMSDLAIRPVIKENQADEKSSTVQTIAPPLETEAPHEAEELARVYFAYNKDNVTPEFEAVLDAAAEKLKAEPTLNLDIFGYADAIGSESYNIELSRRRAENVRRYLAEKGVKRSRLRIKYFGKNHPDNKGGEDQKSRRAELKIRTQK